MNNFFSISWVWLDRFDDTFICYNYSFKLKLVTGFERNFSNNVKSFFFRLISR